MLKKIFAIICLVFAVTIVNNAAFAQRDCEQIDCTGQCGRFVDDDYDGFCDHGQLSAEIKAAEEAAAKEQKKKKTTTIALIACGAVVLCGAGYAIMRKKA